MQTDATLPIDQCFWTYPPPDAAVKAGQPLTFQVVVPPPAEGAGVTTIPLTGSVVNWSLTYEKVENQKVTFVPMVQGQDYQVLEGDLQSPLLSLVFKPVQDRKVSVVPTLSLFGAGQAPSPSHFTAQVYTLSAVTSEAVDRVKNMISGALCLTAGKTIIEPGEPAQLRVVPRSAADIPQVVTSILHDAPSVEIRGALPLGGLVDAIIGPITRALGRVLPGDKFSLDEGGDTVRRMLEDAVTIPIAIDVLGTRLTRTTAPVGTPEVPVFTSTPQETRSYNGLVPIGRWQSPFSIMSATWSLQEGSGTTAYQDLSPGSDFLKSFLLKPAVVPLSTASVSKVNPTPVTVTVTLEVKLEEILSDAVDLTLPPVTLQRLPLGLPQLGAIFRHSFRDTRDQEYPQWVYIVVDGESASFLSSIDDASRMLTRLGGALNNIIAVTNASGESWHDLVNLATTVSVLSAEMSRVAPENVYFEPIWDANGKLELKGPDDAASAIIQIGAPTASTYLHLSGDGNKYYIDIGKSPTFYSCIIPSLNGEFSEMVQIPPGSAIANDPDHNYNDSITELRFVSRKLAARAA